MARERQVPGDRCAVPRGRTAGRCTKWRKLEMRTHTITVTVDQGSIQVDPDELTMFANDEVQWAGTNARKFSIRFGAKSPFGRLELAHDVATAKQRPTVKGEFK